MVNKIMGKKSNMMIVVKPQIQETILIQIKQI